MYRNSTLAKTHYTTNTKAGIFTYQLCLHFVNKTRPGLIVIFMLMVTGLYSGSYGQNPDLDNIEYRITAPGICNAEVGDDIQVFVTINHLNNEPITDITGTSVGFRYNGDILKYDGVTVFPLSNYIWSGSVLGPLTTTGSDAQGDIVYVDIAFAGSGTQATGPGNVFSIFFEVIGPGVSPLEFTLENNAGSPIMPRLSFADPDIPGEYTTFNLINSQDSEMTASEGTFYTRSNNVGWTVATTWSPTSCGDTDVAASAPGTFSQLVICEDHEAVIQAGEAIVNSCELTIESGATIRISESEDDPPNPLKGGILTVTRELTSAGEVIVESGGMFNNLTGNRDVNLTMMRKLKPDEWVYLSSPLVDLNDNNLTFADLLSGIRMQTQNDHGVLLENSNILRWPTDESGNLPGYENQWRVVADISTPVNGGEGAAVFVFDRDQDGNPLPNPELMVQGRERAGFSVTSNSVEEGWALLGNPLPTAISFGAFRNTAVDPQSNQIADAVYVWVPGSDPLDADDNVSTDDDPDNYDGLDYVPGYWKTYADDGNIGDLTDGLIAPFQGFFVQNSTGSSVELDFNNSVKSSSELTEFVFRKERPADVMRLALSGQGMQTSAWVRISPDGSVDRNTSGDAFQLVSHSTDFTVMATKKENGDLFDIGHFPSDHLDQGGDIPLVVKATRSGVYTLDITRLDQSGQPQLYLNDMHRNVSVPITADMSYEFALDYRSKVDTQSRISHINPFGFINKPQKKVYKTGTPRFLISQSRYGVDAEEAFAAVPKQVQLNQNYPNPFNPSTNISYSIPEHTLVRLAVYDVLGRQVGLLVDEFQSFGEYRVSWDATPFSSGLYIYRLDAGGTVKTRTMSLVK